MELDSPWLGTWVHHLLDLGLWIKKTNLPVSFVRFAENCCLSYLLKIGSHKEYFFVCVPVHTGLVLWCTVVITTCRVIIKYKGNYKNKVLS